LEDHPTDIGERKTLVMGFVPFLRGFSHLQMGCTTMGCTTMVTNHYRFFKSWKYDESNPSKTMHFSKERIHILWTAPLDDADPRGMSPNDKTGNLPMKNAWFFPRKMTTLW
jgi:hypothetical protein